MAAMTRFDKIVLGLTAAFLVVTGGYFVSGQLGEAEYQVTVSKQVPAVSASLPGMGMAVISVTPTICLKHRGRISHGAS